MLSKYGIPSKVFNSRSWLWGLWLLLACWWGWALPGWAVSLGDPLPEWAEPMGVGRQQVRGIEQYQGQEQIRAYGNEAGQVFWIQINSQSDLPPDYRAYLGEYQQFPPQVVEVVPLRARILRFSQGNRSAEWRVVGMSGGFQAEAISQDLAPAALK
ncbi:MAG: hypothetical protein Q6M04_12730 [Thermostichus sp. BF3_bins_97]